MAFIGREYRFWTYSRKEVEQTNKCWLDLKFSLVLQVFLERGKIYEKRVNVFQKTTS